MNRWPTIENTGEMFSEALIQEPRQVLDPKAQDRLHHEHSGLTLSRAGGSILPGNQENPESCPDTQC